MWIDNKFYQNSLPWQLVTITFFETINNSFKVAKQQAAKKKEKDFSPLFVYIRGSPRDDDDYTHEEKKFGNLSRKKKL